MGANKKMLRKRRIILASFWLKRYRSQKRMQVHPINKTRHLEGEFSELMGKLEKFPDRFFQYFRMSRDRFYEIFNLIEEELKPKSQFVRQDIIRPLEKMVITLRFLATGTSFVDLSFRFRLGVSTVKKVIGQTVAAINAKCLHIAIPNAFTKNDWKEISDEFLRRWNFPNCLKAVDGKHAYLFAPKRSGSLYFNYKKTFSTNLMAVVDAKYRFIMVDIGAYGSNADSSVFSSSYFGYNWLNNAKNLNVPDDAPLPQTSSRVPYVIIGDEGFALKTTILRPFPGQKLTLKERIFNYRLSRARRVVENAFGIMAQTRRILLKRLEVQKDLANNIILACCILHNLLRINISEAREKQSTQKAQNIKPLESVEAISTSASRAYDIRSVFADWCISEGNVDFQYKMIKIH